MVRCCHRSSRGRLLPFYHLPSAPLETNEINRPVNALVALLDSDLTEPANPACVRTIDERKQLRHDTCALLRHGGGGLFTETIDRGRRI